MCCSMWNIWYLSHCHDYDEFWCLSCCHDCSGSAVVTLAMVLQYLEIAYLFFLGYYWLPALLAALSAAAGVFLILVVRKQSLKMLTLVNQRRLTPIVKGGWVRAVSSHKLVPGDVIVVQRGKATCDMVLLQGSCLVVESMLSGEVCLNATLSLLCCAVLCCAVLCCAVLCCAVLCCAVLCCVVVLLMQVLCCCGVNSFRTGCD